MGRPLKKVCEKDLQTLSELETITKEIHNLQKTLTTLTYYAIDEGIAQKYIANVLGRSVSDVKYLIAKRDKPEWFVKNRNFKGGDKK